jgi:hypothetical protein
MSYIASLRVLWQHYETVKRNLALGKTTRNQARTLQASVETELERLCPGGGPAWDAEPEALRAA